MNRCSFCEWIPILPWPVWPLAGQSLLGQNVVVGSMMVLLALCGSMPRGVYLGPHFRYKCASPRLSADLPGCQKFYYISLSDIEQVQNEKKSFTFRCMLRQMILEDAGEGQPWNQSMWNAWII